MKVKLTKVTRFDRDRNGTPFVHNGRPYTKVSIQTDEHGSEYLSGFGNETTDKWNVGDVVDIEVSRKGNYLNFSIPKLPQGYSFPTKTQEDLDFIKTCLGRIIAMQQEIIGMLGGGTAYGKQSTIGGVRYPAGPTQTAFDNASEHYGDRP